MEDPATFAHFQQSSPLDALVRRTSSRRKPPTVTPLDLSANPSAFQQLHNARDPRQEQQAEYRQQYAGDAAQEPYRQQYDRSPAQEEYRHPYARDYAQEEYRQPHQHYPAQEQYHHQQYPSPPQQYASPPRQQKVKDAPISPLLHTQFRGSTATALTNFDISYTSDNSRQSAYKDDESVYSRSSYAWHDSHGPSMYDDLPPPPARSQIQELHAEPLRDSYVLPEHSPRVQGHDDPLPSPVPTVVVSAPLDLPRPSLGGRTPSQVNGSLNFSRPVRQPAPEEPMTPTTLYEHKRQVLERNAHRHPSTPSQQSLRSVSQGSPSPSPSQRGLRSPSTPNLSSHTPNIYSQAPSYPPSPGALPFPPSPSTPGMPSSPHEPSGSQLTRKITLSNRPPSPTRGSPTSLYSRYSFYQLDGATPAGSRTPSPTRQHHLQQQRAPPRSDTLQPGAYTPRSAASSPSPTQTPAEELLQQGITAHEANRLRESAGFFERSAKEGGGCGVGMLMWGLTLRHGWGVQPDEKRAFKWLKRAAESAVGDLESTRNGMDATAVKSELILAIYEVAQCFFHGWGVPKDQKMAVSYYQVAARLGDPDAQQELGFCLANGRGCKKDRKEAAKWYRAAVKQGVSDVGLAWIYKEKFQ